MLHQRLLAHACTWARGASGGEAVSACWARAGRRRLAPKPTSPPEAARRSAAPAHPPPAAPRTPPATAPCSQSPARSRCACSSSRRPEGRAGGEGDGKGRRRAESERAMLQCDERRLTRSKHASELVHKQRECHLRVPPPDLLKVRLRLVHQVAHALRLHPGRQKGRGGEQRARASALHRLPVRIQTGRQTPATMQHQARQPASGQQEARCSPVNHRAQRGVRLVRVTHAHQEASGDVIGNNGGVRRHQVPAGLGWGAAPGAWAWRLRGGQRQAHTRSTAPAMLQQVAHAACSAARRRA